jgi:hypothetical protein
MLSSVIAILFLGELKYNAFQRGFINVPSILYPLHAILGERTLWSQKNNLDGFRFISFRDEP